MGCAFLKFSNKRHSHLFEKDCNLFHACGRQNSLQEGFLATK